MTTSELRFDEKGLIPAVVQDFYTKKVLTVAYMNAESLDITLREKRTCFWSRSRKELWRKGETSGNVQRIASIRADCDGDALVIEVDREGPACHTGNDSCFFNPVHESEPPFSLIIGNASHVTLSYQGKPVDLSNRSKGDVARITLK